MSDATQIRYGLPRSSSLVRADLPRPGTHVNLTTARGSHAPSALGEMSPGGVLTMDVPPEGMSVLALDVGDPLGVSWSLRGMPCRMRVVRVDAPVDAREFPVTITDGPYLVERREFFRVEAAEGVIIRAPGHESWRATTHDISRSGALIFSSAELTVSQELDMTIDLGDRYGPLPCRATVVRHATERQADAYGVAFIPLPHAEDEVLVKYLTWRQREF